jgi:hypothetical protein
MTVKLPAIVTATLIMSVGLSGCGMSALDNYDQPTSTLSGRVEFEGEPVGVRTNGVQLELWERGYDTPQKIPVYVAQDGSFTAVLFDGEYDLTPIPGNGPWANTSDTLHIVLKGSARVAVPVRPYYTIKDETVSRSADAVAADFRLGQVDASRAVEYVGLYVSSTTFVDRSNMAVRVETPGAAIGALDQPIHLSVTLPANLAAKGEVFARIGVKTVGVAELLFSPVYKLTR